MVIEVTAEDGTKSEKSIAMAAADTTAPVLSATSASSITATAATLNFTSGEAGTYFYLVYAAADAAPTAAAVVAQGAALFKATASASAAAQTISLTGLTAATAYKAHLVVRDAANNISLVSTIEVTTAAAPAPTPAQVTVSLSTQPAITVVVPSSLEVGKTATLTTTGGAMTGSDIFLSNSAAICTVSRVGVVTALASGTCSVAAQRSAPGFTTAVSADATFKVMSAAEVKAIADAAIKAAADKAAADAAAAEAKAAADKAEAEAKAKAAAEAVAAEAARVEAVRLAGLNTVGNIKTVKGKTSISMNLADRYYGYILELQVRTVVKGKAKFTTIEYFAVERADGVVTVSTMAKLAKGQQLRILSDGKVVRTLLR
jgi:hypothetical protein